VPSHAFFFTFAENHFTRGGTALYHAYVSRRNYVSAILSNARITASPVLHPRQESTTQLQEWRDLGYFSVGQEYDTTAYQSDFSNISAGHLGVLTYCK
jgi:hypothetical protein